MFLRSCDHIAMDATKRHRIEIPSSDEIAERIASLKAEVRTLSRLLRMARHVEHANLERIKRDDSQQGKAVTHVTN